MAKTFYLAGQWVDSPNVLEIKNPFDGRLVAEVAQAEATHLEKAIDEAQKVFAITRKLSPHEKYAALMAMSKELAERAEEAAKILVEEAGKPIKDARVEVTRGIHTLELSAAVAREMRGEEYDLGERPYSQNHRAVIRRFPIGTVAGIVPFNFPLNLALHKVGPALAVGNPIIIKPAGQTPLSSLFIAELFDHTNYPKAALSVLPCSREVGNILVTDERIKLLSFTGSDAVGWQLKSQAGKKKVVLELGGNAAVLVHDDADLALAAKMIAKGGFAYAGQSCISVQRLFLHESVKDQFLEKFLPLVRALKVGDPRLPETDVASLIDLKAAARLQDWLKEAAVAGAKILTGGEIKNTMMTPTVLETNNFDIKLCTEEAFAPIVVIITYRDFDGALQLVNSSRYGLQTGIFTTNQKLINRAFEELEVGGVIINNVSAFRADQMPYGGVKDSGQGREGPRYAAEEMTEMKVLVTSNQ